MTMETRRWFEVPRVPTITVTEAAPEPPAPETKEHSMAVSVELNKKLDKAWEDKSLAEILAAPPSALAGLTEKHDEIFAQLGIKSIKDLGSNKYFAVAGVLVALSGHVD